MVDIAIVQLGGPAAPKAVNYSLTCLAITFVFLACPESLMSTRIEANSMHKAEAQ